MSEAYLIFGNEGSEQYEHTDLLDVAFNRQAAESRADEYRHKHRWYEEIYVERWTELGKDEEYSFTRRAMPNDLDIAARECEKDSQDIRRGRRYH